MTAYIHLNTFRDGRDVQPGETEITVDYDGSTYLLEVLETTSPQQTADAFFAAANPDANGERHELVKIAPRRFRIDLA